MSDQEQNVRVGGGTCCGPGCSCGTDGLSKGCKWLISGVVVLVACVVIAARVSGEKESAPKTEQGFALPVVAAPAATAGTPELVGWDAPLKGLGELNVVATNTEAVFVVIPADDAARTVAIQKEVAAASATISGRGTKMGKYLLSKDAGDYKGVAAQFGAPAVLAMVKGKGLSVVADKDVTQDALLKAFVGVSRPRSGCGAGGCGPRGCN